MTIGCNFIIVLWQDLTAALSDFLGERQKRTEQALRRA